MADGVTEVEMSADALLADILVDNVRLDPDGSLYNRLQRGLER